MRSTAPQYLQSAEIPTAAGRGAAGSRSNMPPHRRTAGRYPGSAAPRDARDSRVRSARPILIELECQATRTDEALIERETWHMLPHLILHLPGLGCTFPP